jgi:HAD superfamily hydrolase (TIGR01509 family)
MIKALIFDFDGLILDTETSEFQSWQEIFADHGCDLPFPVWAESIGAAVHSFNPYEFLEKQIRRPLQRDEIRARHRRRWFALLEAQDALPGVREYIAQAAGMGLKLGLASSSRHPWVDGHLTRLGLKECFAAIVCADDVAEAKPAPDLYLLALRRLNIAAGRAVAFEDSPNGARAAKAAGIFCVAVPNALTRQLSLDHADLRLASLAVMPLAELMRKVETMRAQKQPRPKDSPCAKPDRPSPAGE